MDFLTRSLSESEAHILIVTMSVIGWVWFLWLRSRIAKAQKEYDESVDKCHCCGQKINKF